MTLTTIETLDAQALAAATCAATSYADVLHAAGDDLSAWIVGEMQDNLTTFQRKELERLAVLMRTVAGRVGK